MKYGDIKCMKCKEMAEYICGSAILGQEEIPLCEKHSREYQLESLGKGSFIVSQFLRRQVPKGVLV